MTKGRVIGFGLLLLAAVLVVLFSTRHGTHPDQSGASGTTALLANVLKLFQRDDISDRWRTPIEFYGLVLDQNDKPVAGVTASFGWTDTSAKGHSERTALSDVNGRFELTGVKGYFLTAKVEKEGYYTSQTNPINFAYGNPDVRFRSDKRQPVIFKLHKKGEAEPLIRQSIPGFARYVQVSHLGDPKGIDLLTGKIVPAAQGHLMLQLWSPDEKTQKLGRYNWRCRLTINGGGIQTAQQEFDYVAPETGYEPFEEVIVTNEIERNWRMSYSGNFFVRLSNGTYGRFQFEIMSHNGFFTIESYFNPSGSRNLEYDKTLQIKP